MFPNLRVFQCIPGHQLEPEGGKKLQNILVYKQCLCLHVSGSKGMLFRDMDRCSGRKQLSAHVTSAQMFVSSLWQRASPGAPHIITMGNLLTQDSASSLQAPNQKRTL